MLGLISFNNSTPKTPIRRKVSRISPIHAELSYFFAVATGVSGGRMILSSFNSQILKKNPARCRNLGLRWYFL